MKVDAQIQAPLLIGLSARIYTPGSAGVDLPGVWTKHLHYLEQSAAHWVMSGGALAVMVPALQAGALPGEPVSLDHYAQALDGLVLQGGNDVAPQGYGEEPLHPDWRGDPVRDATKWHSSAPSCKPASRCLASAAACSCSTCALAARSAGHPHPAPEALDHRQLGRYEDHFHAVEFVPGTHLASLYPARHVPPPTASTTRASRTWRRALWWRHAARKTA
jgi:putative glutamine amidotransferase